MLQRGRLYREVTIGDSFDWSISITDSHLAVGAGLIGDFNPLHVDETFARASRYEGRILHGMITSALIGGPLGMYFAGSAIAYLEHAIQFIAPVRAHDTLAVNWTVTNLVDKPRANGGVVSAQATGRNQDGVLVATAQAKMLVGNEYGAFATKDASNHA